MLPQLSPTDVRASVEAYKATLPDFLQKAPLTEVYSWMSTANLVTHLPEKTRQNFVTGLTEENKAFLQHAWGFWGRPDQFEPRPAGMWQPPGQNRPPVSARKWRSWLAMAGRGWGKTKTGAEWIIQCSRYHSRMALIGETVGDVRDVMIEGPSGIMACSKPWERPTYVPSKRELRFPNGSVAKTFSGETPDQLRGPNHEVAWCDELAKFRYADETWAQLQFGLRIGEWPRTLVTTTPRPLPIIKKILKGQEDGSTHVTRGTTYHNASNMAAEFFDALKAEYEGTRLGRQELMAELLMDLPGALWTLDVIDKCVIKNPILPGGHKAYPDFVRVVVAVDPSGSDGETGDHQGIVVAGICANGVVYIIEDASVKEDPKGWAKATSEAFHRNKADMIVGERNFGGEMVRHVIRTHDHTLPFKLVTASRGKALRAEPVSNLYAQGRVKHIGHFDKLEEQMTQITGQGYQGDDSPDRLDAMVWAVTELAMPERIAQATSGHRY